MKIVDIGDLSIFFYLLYRFYFIYFIIIKFKRARAAFANPFLLRLCKELWKLNPEFLVVAECMGGPGFENREIDIVKSGPVPRLYTLPMALS